MYFSEIFRRIGPLLILVDNEVEYDIVNYQTQVCVIYLPKPKQFANEDFYLMQNGLNSEHWPKRFYLVVPLGSSASNNHYEFLHLFLLSSWCWNLYPRSKLSIPIRKRRRIAQPYLQTFDSTTRMRGLETRRTLNST